MKIKEIRDMKKEELIKFISEKKEQGIMLRFDIASKQVKNHRAYRDLKKDIAKATTVLSQMEANQ